MTTRRPRAHTESLPGGLRVTVRNPRRWPMLLMLAPWLAGWAIAEAAVIAYLLGGLGMVQPATHHPAPTLLVTWLAVWTMGGLFLAAALAWNAFGREVVEVSGRALRVHQEALGIGRTLDYDTAEIGPLRVSTARVAPLSLGGALRYWGFGNGVVAFDHRAQTVRVLRGLDELEASAIVAELNATLKRR